MLKSMTGFGRSRKTVSGKNITAEIKSVNGRFFDCSVKLSRAYSFLEQRVRDEISKRGISRGKVDVWIGVDVVDSEGVTVTLDDAYVRSYIAALERLRDEYGLKDDITVGRVAAKQDVFIVQKPEEDAERDWEDIRVVLDEALEGFIDSREREGARLAADLEVKLSSIEEHIARVKALSEADIGGYRERLEARLRQILDDNSINIDENRLLTEVAIFADRAAIDEELVRLSSHTAAFREIVAAPEPSGRKLDFLLQEINREVNTIGSKAQNAEIARLVIEMKTELEKIREQIQNIE